jgi:methyl-accepting chemotaxis protein
MRSDIKRENAARRQPGAGATGGRTAKIQGGGNPRRYPFAVAVILFLAACGAAVIDLKEKADLHTAQQRFRLESHAGTELAATAAQQQFTYIYQNLRTMSRLPSVKSIDRHATNISANDTTTIQELYNNLGSDVDVSEVYIVPASLDADQIDPVTGAPQTPILMFDDLISNDAGGGDVTRRFEAEIYEYHLLHHQMQWFAQHVPNVKATDGFDLPMISGPQVITCDNTVYNATLNNSDRTGMIFSVPFFGPDGNFKGSISAIIRVKAVRAVLPAQNFALVNPAYGALLVSGKTALDPIARRLAAAAKPDPRLIYSEVLRLDVHDPRTTWSLWAEVPNAIFYARPDVRAARVFAIGASLTLLTLVLIALGAVLSVARNDRMIGRASRALDLLASGDEHAQLLGGEKSGAVGDLARAFAKFRDALIEKRELEQLAAVEREAADAERRRRDEERAKALAEQKTVVGALASALISFAKGDLTWRIKEWFSADFKGLRMDFNLASEKMDATMRRVMNSTLNVEIGAGEIREVSSDLARRTEKQASQLEGAAATLDEVTGTVAKTSQNAASAARLATAAHADASASGQVVGDTVNAMTQIERSSNEIASIVGVIDEIAFQTNLLALNAGIEAARAGDAGRGFAVVATEVRALAQRSAAAAKEIKVIISSSGEQVGNGVKLVNETGQALLRITGQINELTHLVGDIADAAQQQAHALVEINATVSQMDQITQQNLGIVEQAAIASASLSTEASALSALVQEFKMSEETENESQSDPSNIAPLRAHRADAVLSHV